MKEYTLEQLQALFRCVVYTFGENDKYNLDDDILLFWIDEIKKAKENKVKEKI